MSWTLLTMQRFTLSIGSIITGPGTLKDTALTLPKTFPGGNGCLRMQKTFSSNSKTAGRCPGNQELTVSSPLGVDYEFARQTYVVLDPANLAIAAPQLHGIPFVYTQYRITAGFQWGG